MPTHEDVNGKRVHTEEKLAELLRELLSTLVVAPGHPEHGPFYVVHGLLNAIPLYQWQPGTGVQTRVYIDMLALQCTYAQRKFPYHVPLVESNDALYGGAPGYMYELNQSITTCVAEIVKQLTAIGERPDNPSKLTQARLILDLVNQLGSRMELDGEVGSFVIKLLELACKSKPLFTRADLRYLANTVDFLKKQVAGSLAAPILPTLKAL